ncbi:DivIVA domain-containing protein [Arthrobacter sp. H5]|uniref:DivIVA domain-containing protein n=1 Tax=Arthrobacter sp. H5 TaxID=1267973 RepID=UPI000483B7EA|nr:DivIVA domain-containing protein [Arthrobacter sp. H5]
MSIFLVFIAVALVGITSLLAVGRLRRTDPDGLHPWDPAVVPGLVEPTPSLPAVLLPENPGPADIHRLRFALGLRGYRMDQVDEVLDRLAAVLEQRDATIAALRADFSEEP